MRFGIALAAILLFGTAGAGAEVVHPRPGALADAIASAGRGAVLQLVPGHYEGRVLIDRPLTIDCEAGAIIDGGGEGSVLTVTSGDVVILGCEIRGSGDDHEEIDSGIRILKGADRVRIEGNRMIGNLYGVDIHGGRDALVRFNTIVGRDDFRMNDRGNGVYVWNAPGAVVEANDISFGRDGIFSNTSSDNAFKENLFRDLRFAVHYMYTNDSEVSGNISIGNHLGFAIMFSRDIKVIGNMSLADRDHGIMLNYANKADVIGNLVRGGTEKCTFIYNAHNNLIADNRFEACDIGVHFTAGSERNVLTGNAFVNNRTQVKYVGSRDVEWSFEGRGNYWSDHPAFDLDGDGIADGHFRPNDLMDHILWSQPAAKLLMGSPAVQLIRWSQESFPATLPGGVVDSYPMIRPVRIEVPERIRDLELEGRRDKRAERTDDELSDAFAGH